MTAQLSSPLRPLLGATLVAAALFFAAPMASIAHADEITDGIAQLPGAIEDVRVAGTWDRDGETGIYRVLIARNGGNAVTARLFVQWVAYHVDGTAELKDSMEIKEFAELAIDIVDYISESDADGLTLYIQADNPDPAGSETYELFVFGPGDYLFDAATN